MINKFIRNQTNKQYNYNKNPEYTDRHILNHVFIL